MTLLLVQLSFLSHARLVVAVEYYLYNGAYVQQLDDTLRKLLSLVGIFILVVDSIDIFSPFSIIAHNVWLVDVVRVQPPPRSLRQCRFNI